MADLRKFPSPRGLTDEPDDMPPFPPMEAYGDDFGPSPAEPSGPAGAGDELPEPEPLASLPPVDVAGVLTNPSPPPEFVWHGLVPRAHVCLLSGHGGSGKSTLSLQLAVAVATGAPLFGIPTQRARVLVLSAEDAGPIIRHRLAAICRAMNTHPEPLAAWLRVLDGSDNPVLAEEMAEQGRRFLATTATYEALREAVLDWQPGLVVIDGASDVFSANENDRAQVRHFTRQLIAIIRQVESHPAVLLLTHTPKQAVGGRGESYSGSTSWHNSARARLSLTPEREGDGLVLSLDKLNLAPMRREPLRLVRSHGGVLVLDEGAREHDTEGDAQEPPEVALLRILADFNRRGEHVSPEQSARNNVWKTLRPEPSFPKRRYPVAGALFSAMRGLERQGLIERGEYVNPHRKRYEQWLLTAMGWEAIGESAPTAPTAPTSEESALDAEGGAGAPTAPTSGAKESEEKERAQDERTDSPLAGNPYRLDEGALGTRADGTNPRANGTNPRARRKGAAK
jgi:hypothetical protein